MTDPTEYPDAMSAEEAKARSKRNLIIALSLAGFMGLIFTVTLVKIREGVARKQDWEEATGRSGKQTPAIEAGEGPVTTPEAGHE